MVTREVLYEQRPLWVMTECNERASLQPRSIPTRLRKSVGTLTNSTVNNLELGMTVAAWCCHQTSTPLGPWAGWAVGDAPGRTPQGRLGPTCWGWGSACLELLRSPGRTASSWQDSIPWAGQHPLGRQRRLAARPGGLGLGAACHLLSSLALQPLQRPERSGRTDRGRRVVLRVIR